MGRGGGVSVPTPPNVSCLPKVVDISFIPKLNYVESPLVSSFLFLYVVAPTVESAVTLALVIITLSLYNIGTFVSYSCARLSLNLILYYAPIYDAAAVWRSGQINAL